jgi:hypothetical protein
LSFEFWVLRFAFCVLGFEWGAGNVASPRHFGIEST